MSQSLARNYAGLSKEERIQRRQNLLIEMAMMLSDELGWHQVTVDRLCQKAQLNKRYFYENYHDIDALASAVVDHLAQEIMQKISEVMLPNMPIEQMAYKTIDVFVRYITVVPSRAKLLFGELNTTDQMSKHRKRLVNLIVSEVSRNARDIHQPKNVSDEVIETCALFLIGGTGQVVLNWLDSSETMSINELIDHITRLWLITGNGAAAYARQHNES